MDRPFVCAAKSLDLIRQPFLSRRSYAEDIDRFILDGKEDAIDISFVAAEHMTHLDIKSRTLITHRTSLGHF